MNGIPERIKRRGFDFYHGIEKGLHTTMKNPAHRAGLLVLSFWRA